MDANEFKVLRARLRLTSRALADQLGIENSTVYRYESGKRAIPSRIADRLRRYASEKGDGGMDRYALADLIRQHGVTAVGNATEGIPVMIREGWDLTDWYVHVGGGAALFFRSPWARRSVPDPELAALESEMHELRTQTEPRTHLYQPDKQRQAFAAQMRLNDLVPRVRARREALAAANLPSESPPTEQVLCVNAPESERATYEAMIAEPDRPPTLLLMTPGGRVLP